MFITASFPKLLKAFASTERLRTQLRWIYEVHQLAKLDFGAGSARDKTEAEALANADAFVTTTDALKALLLEGFATKPCVNLGLACGGLAGSVSMPRPFSHGLVLGYLGSVYRGQGVDWLVENWSSVCSGLNQPARLLIAGGDVREVEVLRRKAEEHSAGNVEFLGKVPQAEIPDFLARVNALVIPATSEGRMPYVAITKAYDYLGYQRPVVTASIPSITEVMRSGQEAVTFTPCTVESLVEGLKLLLAKPTLGDDLVVASGARALKLDWQSRAAKYWSWLLEVAARRS